MILLSLLIFVVSSISYMLGIIYGRREGFKKGADHNRKYL